jgi:tetratricopeptide (TPR) repeat protein
MRERDAISPWGDEALSEKQRKIWTPTEAEARLDQLINSPAPADAEAAVDVLGWMIDVSETLRRLEGIEAALVLGESLLRRSLEPAHRVLVHYFLSNAWEVKRLFVRSGSALDEWEQPELEREIIHLRKALQSAAEGEIDSVRLCQIHTNLGNLLSHCGRFIDAIQEWDRALAIDPKFAMALGNRGYGLIHYGELIYTWHQVLFFREAYADLTRALAVESSEVHADARASFEEAVLRLEAGVPEHVLRHPAHEHKFPDDMEPDELEYRQWCLAHRLFLNDLNDLGADPLAAADQATLPGLLMPIGTGIPHSVGFFNQLKQEYVSARYLYYEGVTTEEAHYSDRRVLLANTGDYPAYGIPVERVKAAFRIAYSLLDKVAYFLNDYLALGIPETRVSFRGLWYDRQDRARGLRSDLGGAENAPLKGLFWIAKIGLRRSRDSSRGLSRKRGNSLRCGTTLSTSTSSSTFLADLKRRREMITPTSTHWPIRSIVENLSGRRYGFCNSVGQHSCICRWPCMSRNGCARAGRMIPLSSPKRLLLSKTSGRCRHKPFVVWHECPTFESLCLIAGVNP